MAMLSKNALILLKKRYLKRDRSKRIVEDPEGLFRRVAHAIALAESNFSSKNKVAFWEAEFYSLLTALDFLPNSPTLMNAGREMGQLSACFVLPIEDSMTSIFETLKNAALIQQSGGGCGYNFSALRPEGDYVGKTGGTASGPLSFMKMMDAATNCIKQGGKRRGANMGILNIDHPDIMKFIKAKRKGDVLRNFNISIAVSDSFMRALESNETWSLIHPNTKKPRATLAAKSIWKEIIQSAWECGDPGLLFIDEINRHNPSPHLGMIRACNPCGEMPLLDWEACNLGSINLKHILLKIDGKHYVDWNKLKKTVHLAIRFLDNVIEVNNYILPQIEKISKANRKIGLGVMGWADLLILLNIPYNSEKAVGLGEKIMHFIEAESSNASMQLAKERGVFPNWNKSIYYPDSPMRNATRTSIAPTGSISIIANTSSSIEPVFALSYQRKQILDGETLYEVHPVFLDYLLEHNIIASKEELITEKKGIDSLVNSLTKDVKKVLITSLEIPWEFHLKHQIAFQKYTDNAVSKTINLPETASIEMLGNVFQQAWESKAKGITVYRYNSLKAQVLNVQEKEDTLPVLLQDGISNCKICMG